MLTSEEHVKCDNLSALTFAFSCREQKMKRDTVPRMRNKPATAITGRVHTVWKGRTNGLAALPCTHEKSNPATDCLCRTMGNEIKAQFWKPTLATTMSNGAWDTEHVQACNLDQDCERPNDGTTERQRNTARRHTDAPSIVNMQMHTKTTGPAIWASRSPTWLDTEKYQQPYQRNLRDAKCMQPQMPHQTRQQRHHDTRQDLRQQRYAHALVQPERSSHSRVWHCLGLHCTMIGHV